VASRADAAMSHKRMPGARESRWLRPELQGLPTYGVAVVSPSRYAGPTYKLSSNESPFAPNEKIVAAITQAARSANLYPEMFGENLAGTLAAHYGLPADRVAVAGGSLVLLQQAVQAVASPGEEVLFGWRSYEAYPIIAQTARCQTVTVPLREHRLELQRLSEHVNAATRVVIVCSPNNPTSTDISSDTLEAFLEELPPTCLVILDEAYREFSTDATVPDGLRLQDRFDQLLVLRTFSKAYSLAGVRIGWCAGHPDIIRALRRVALPFTVSSLAQAAAVAAITEDTRTGQEHTATLVQERSRVSASLREVGFEVPASQTNFLWLPLGDRAESFAEKCGTAGVSVRCFKGEGVRITIGAATANDRVVDVAQSFALGTRARSSARHHEYQGNKETR